MLIRLVYETSKRDPRPSDSYPFLTTTTTIDRLQPQVPEAHWQVVTRISDLSGARTPGILPKVAQFYPHARRYSCLYVPQNHCSYVAEPCGELRRTCEVTGISELLSQFPPSSRHRPDVRLRSS